MSQPSSPFSTDSEASAASGVKQAFEQIGREGADFDPALVERLALRFIPLRWTGVSSRVFSHWRAEGLIDMPDLPEGREREAVRLTAPEYIYVRVLSILRLFGMPLEALREVRRRMQAAPNIERYLADEARILASQGRILTASELAASKADWAKLFPTQDQGGTIGYLILFELAAKVKVRLHVFANGYCLSEVGGQIRFPLGFERLATLAVDISYLIAELAMRLELEGGAERLDMLTPNERRILTLVREGKAKSITIRMDEQGALPLRLEYKRGSNSDEDQLHRLISELRANPFATVEIRGNGPKPAYSEVTLRENLPAAGNKRA